MPRRVSRLVTSYAEELRPRFLPTGVSPDDLSQPLVFNERRRPYERTGLYRRVARILTAAGLADRASVQVLRHTYGYLAYLRTGGNLLFVQRQLGHAHPRITSVYAQFVDESYADLAELVAADGGGEVDRAASNPQPHRARQEAAPDDGDGASDRAGPNALKARPTFDCEID